MTVIGEKNMGFKAEDIGTYSVRSAAEIKKIETMCQYSSYYYLVDDLLMLYWSKSGKTHGFSQGLIINNIKEWYFSHPNIYEKLIVWS